MPQTSIVLSSDAVGQIFVLALFFLLALYLTVKWAVAAALREHREAQDPNGAPTSIDHYGG